MILQDWSFIPPATAHFCSLRPTLESKPSTFASSFMRRSTNNLQCWEQSKSEPTKDAFIIRSEMTPRGRRKSPRIISLARIWSPDIIFTGRCAAGLLSASVRHRIPAKGPPQSRQFRCKKELPASTWTYSSAYLVEI